MLGHMNPSKGGPAVKTLANLFQTRRAGEWYTHLLASILGDQVDIRLYCEEDGSIHHLQPADLYLINVPALPPEAAALIPPEQRIFPRLTFLRSSVELLRPYPQGTRTMLVNQSMEMAMESISDLLRLGVHGLQLHPYAPGAPIPQGCSLALTVGYPELAPPGPETVIDLGPRYFQPATVAEIALRLELPEVLEEANYRAYTDSLAMSNYSLDNLTAKASVSESNLMSLLGALPLGIVGVDEKDRIFAFNAAAEAMLGVQARSVLHRTVPETAQLLPRAFFLNQETSPAGRDAHIVHFHQTDFSVTSAPILRNQVRRGYFTMLQPFAEEERTQHRLRLQLLKKGHTSKYCFDDIVAACPEMCRAKTIAQKMAATSASVLLMGESGTGKELFAHAIHHASPRRDMPFVAINCAALPESLLESELFGYADGAFTGAKKGGKLGLFEYAHRGTLFLDEIEGMSPTLQVKLLRVLQEKEVMRVGGSEIIPVDVRIVAASNENIPRMVENGTFRKDLYYRLNTMLVEIPPLRRRGQDILLLFQHICWQIGADIILTPEAQQMLLHHSWEGNVRELRNLAEYLKYMDVRTVTAADLPVTFRPVSAALPVTEEFCSVCGRKRELGRFLLRALDQGARRGIIPGRRQLAAMAAMEDLPAGEQEIRGLMGRLVEAGFLVVCENRKGYRLTEKAEALRSASDPGF